jgi:hypothetical protein
MDAVTTEVMQLLKFALRPVENLSFLALKIARLMTLMMKQLLLLKSPNLSAWKDLWLVESTPTLWRHAKINGLRHMML